MTKVKLTFQGEKGAYSHLACEEIFKDADIKNCPTFEETFKLAFDQEDYRAIIPIENSLAGRVADIHYLLPKYKLQIYGEHFQKVEHCLLSRSEAKLEDIKYVRSHAQAIGQCQEIIKKHKFKPIISADTAGSAKDLSESKDNNVAAIASELAAKIYGLKILQKNIEDDKIQNKKLKRTSPACIIYTSGTGGNPKGVILSHGGILNNLVGACEIMRPLFNSRPVFLTWLPLSHSYEHCVQFAQIAVGAKVFYAEKIEKLLENISEAKPTIMTAVPRFYQNLYNKININLKKQTGLKAKLINATLRLGKKKLLNQKMNFFEKLLNLIVEVLVRKKIKKQFGGNLKAFVSGGGALDKEIGEFLNSIGLPTLQGYGLTETSPVVSCNPIHKIKVETVGPPFRGNQVKIAEDGEILVKGENVMLGYWNKKKETDEVIIDGWLHTGDIGEIDTEDGYLKITDRKKDIIVSAGGDNISPAKIENMITNEPEIDQCMVYGDKKNYLVALIVPSKDFLREKEKINNVIEKINKKLTLLEKIKKIQLIDENFSIENGLMTPTMKVKRKKVTEKYKDQLEKLY